MNNLTDEEVSAIAEIEATSNILRLVTRLTDMRFAAIAKVTDSHWIACAVHDELHFGIEKGDELLIETTLCNELRIHRKAIVIEHASFDPVFAQHPLPKHHGFESYISLPIIFADGTFFGTLCALDTLPKRLENPQIMEVLTILTRLISTTLDLQRRMKNETGS
ncbi:MULTISPECIES: GAF domain-containing protein [unclassified Pseudomonas]|uniref:GAF domain-containing protein n=1 Tax=unclassified Pseudomonas TaxID=196821 RepID=UPI002AC9E851|nr:MULTISPECIES: GAF domain-containing protein [unclassified Pseudomonas]MEB0046713.1 GAF domain-containing protein [Pseudomonas sp. Dout3]MEB0098595.1 GAF domain-containing protein [Pseudomonas sp. DC1.2]WPX61605.1 GAF domain-containing protein [Pseudomonas sp. DC1.2]